MKKPLLKTILAALIAATFFLVGGAKADDLRRVPKKDWKIESLSATFIQEKRMEILVKPLVSTGRFYYRAPHCLRWEYLSPFRSVLLMKDGAARRFVDSGGKMVEDSSMRLEGIRLVMEDISKWLMGDFSHNSTFAVETPAPDRVTLLVKEVAISRFIEKIEIALSDKPGVIDAVTIFESQNSSTEIRFENVEVNPELKDTLFSER